MRLGCTCHGTCVLSVFIGLFLALASDSWRLLVAFFHVQSVCPLKLTRMKIGIIYENAIQQKIWYYKQFFFVTVWVFVLIPRKTYKLGSLCSVIMQGLKSTWSGTFKMLRRKYHLLWREMFLWEITPALKHHFWTMFEPYNTTFWD